MERFSLYFFMICFFSALFFSCSESEPEIIKRLSIGIRKNSQKEEKIKGYEKEIVYLLTKRNYKSSQLISKANQNRIIKPTSDGKILFWIEPKTRQLHYVQNGKKTQFELVFRKNFPEDTLIIDFNPSWSGNYLLVLFYEKEKKTCVPRILSLRKKRFLRKELPSIECGHTPIISDDANIIHYHSKGEIVRQPLIHRDLSSPSFLVESITFSRQNFVEKYKKVKSHFILYPIGPQGILILFGNAGYYQLYHYDGIGDKLKKHNLIFSSGKLYFSSRIIETQKDNIPFFGKDMNKGEDNFQNAQAFIYSGGAGKRLLHQIKWGNDVVKIGAGLSAPVLNDLIYLRKQKLFLGIQDSYLYLWDPNSGEDFEYTKNSDIDANENKMLKIPLSIRKLISSQNGIAYIDLYNQLYFYEKVLTKFELDLILFYNKIRQIKLEWEDE